MELSPENGAYWLQQAGALTPIIREKLEWAAAHARDGGFDPNAATTTYEDNFGCGDLFNARYVRYRVPHRTRDEHRRYTVYAYTYQDSYVMWTDERSALASDRSHQHLLGALDEISDEQMKAMFGAGNEPLRDHLQARPHPLAK